MSHGAEFHKNPRFCVGNHFHDLENVSVNGMYFLVNQGTRDYLVQEISEFPMSNMEMVKMLELDWLEF